MNATDTLDTQLDPKAPDIDALVNRLQTLFDARGLPPALFQSFAMAFDEVISNTAAYGSAHGANRPGLPVGQGVVPVSTSEASSIV